MHEAWRAVTREPDELGESPYWQADEGRLYWVDIAGRAVRRADPATGAAERWPLPDEPGCIAPVRAAGAASGSGGGGWILALRSGIYRARTWGGALECIARLPYDPAQERANDGKCDPLGRFWVGTRDERSGGGQHAAVYCIDARHGPAQVRRMWGGGGTFNGLAWSPDQRTLYSADTPTHRIEARSWEADANAPGPVRVLHQFSPKPAGWQPGDAGYGGRPDGAAVDTQGNYWCAMYEGGRVLQLSPAGALLQSIQTPVACPTMVCLGGPDGRTLFVTSARQGRAAHERARTPLAGCVLALVRAVAVPGLPVQAFAEAAGDTHGPA